MNSYEFKSTRRRALKIISTAIIAVLALLTARFTRFFVSKKRSRTIVLPNPSPKVLVEPEVFIVHKEKSIRVFSRTCPHLGCTIRLDLQKQRFVCPCHGSQFQLNGTYISGPAKTDLRALPFKQTGRQITFSL